MTKRKRYVVTAYIKLLKKRETLTPSMLKGKADARKKQIMATERLLLPRQRGMKLIRVEESK